MFKSSNKFLELNEFLFFKDEVIALIEKQLCGHLGALNATCVEYVDAYGKVIIYELSQKIDPSIICHNTLHLCSAKPPMVNKLGSHNFRCRKTN